MVKQRKRDYNSQSLTELTLKLGVVEHHDQLCDAGDAAVSDEKKQVDSRHYLADVSLLSKCTPRSRTQSTGLMTTPSTLMLTLVV